jgi:mannitol-1-phosphate 5-dehydrogenase
VKFLQFGAGNIGRSFMGRIFSAAGWEVVFVDVDRRLVNLINEKRRYTVIIKEEGREDERREAGPVRAVHGGDEAAAAAELAGADIAAVSVGKAALEQVLPLLARGLEERRRLYGDRPLDIIIAENAREAPALFRTVLARELGPSWTAETLSAAVGIVETSIGKMVPLLGAEEAAADPLTLYAEAYETLIVDARGFRGPVPAIENILPVEPIRAYVDRKLFVHNLGHAAAAYLGCRALADLKGAANPGEQSVPAVLSLPGVEEGTRNAMDEAAAALLREYPGVFRKDGLAAHINELLARFKNTALRDRILRVGRDIRRKLGREDRITGAMLLGARHGLPFGAAAEVYLAGVEFDPPGAAPFPPDAAFRQDYGLAAPLTEQKLGRILREVSGLREEGTPDGEVYGEVLRAFTRRNRPVSG